MKKALIVALVAMAGLTTVSSSQAAGPYGYGTIPWWGVGNGFGTTYERQRLPYFSLYPPVYYSTPVPRTYGYSPFAYPPGTMTPDIVDAEPITVFNPYVPQPGGSKQAERTAQAPMSIKNPFVARPASSGSPAGPQLDGAASR
jgi:hypothetical protein